MIPHRHKIAELKITIQYNTLSDNYIPTYIKTKRLTNFSLILKSKLKDVILKT